jgi:hypothetical protein
MMSFNQEKRRGTYKEVQSMVVDRDVNELNEPGSDSEGFRLQGSTVPQSTSCRTPIVQFGATCQVTGADT